MPARYLACAADPGGEAALAALARAMDGAEGWSPVTAGGDLRVWTRGGRPPARPLPGGGVLLGLWRGGSLPEPGEPRDRAARLIAGGFGGYVALLPGRPGAPPALLRDPSGALDALTWRAGAVRLAADDLDGLPPGLAPADLALDWDAVADLVRRPLSAAGRSAFRGLHPVTAGDLQTMGEAAGPDAALWRPAWAAGRAAPADPAAALQASVLEAVDGLAAGAGGLLVEVSGGLDSGIVAAALAARGHGGGVRAAVNQYAAQAEGDERAWAGAVGEALGLPMAWLEKRVEPFTEADFQGLARSVRPAVEALDPPRDRDYLRLAAELDAQTLFTGQGGDAVFFQMPCAHVVGDLVAARGWRAAFGSEARGVARWLRRSLWSVRAEARRPPNLQAAPASAFLGARARAVASGPAHPWLADLEALPPAKQVQVATVTLGQLKAGPSRRGQALDVRHPLLAQPVLETALAIPSWTLLQGGRDRGLARAAFAPLLPPQVAARRSKGNLSTLYARRVAASLDVLRPWLLDGVLTSAEVLDRRVVEAALTAEDLIWRGAGIRLLQAAMVEGWARWWQTRVPDFRSAGRGPS